MNDDIREEIQIHFKIIIRSEEQSDLCFGLIVWYVFFNRQDEWYFGRFENKGVPIKGMTYFRKKY